MEQDSSWSSQELELLRRQIDRVDDQILSLLVQRQELASQIGRVKLDLGLEMLDSSRERQVLARLKSRASKELPPQAIASIFSEIISAARAVQQPLVVAYLGPEGTFSHQAALSFFGRSASFRPARSIEEVFHVVDKGAYFKGVVPAENSCEGSVGSTLDALWEYDLKIEGEILVRIRHHLLSRAAHLGQIKRLYSHPLAIGQCRLWIKENLSGVAISEVSSTAAAARLAAEQPDAAAIGNRLACRYYPLKVLAPGIEDHAGNVTRFLVMGKTSPGPTGDDKTSFLFSLKHEPGSLYRALAPLAVHGINMTRIESRPLRSAMWEYLFFIDIQGHMDEHRVSKALQEMEGHCSLFKFLGSYPRGGEAWDGSNSW